MSEKEKNPHIGSSLDDWLKEEGIFEEVTAAAKERVKEIQARIQSRSGDKPIDFDEKAFMDEGWEDE